MNHQVHEAHTHVHSGDCGHKQIMHGDHVDFLHDGHLHAAHNMHFDECSIAVSAENPADCANIECTCGHTAGCTHETIPHGDHVDHLVGNRLHFSHADHCDDHGEVYLM